MDKGTKLQDYEGVSIYVSRSGRFFCDLQNNSDDYKKATNTSEKLESLIKAIDNYNGGDIDGNEYYYIDAYSGLKKIKVIRNVGTLLFFNDGTKSTDWSRRDLYPADISTLDDFKLLEDRFKTLSQLEEELKDIQTKLSIERVRIREIFNKFKKVKPCV